MTKFDATISGEVLGAGVEERLDRPRVLLVDDDELVLSALQSLFRLRADYDIHAETNPARAARLLGSKHFDVVISDFLMPGMDGIQLLETAAKLQPQAIRILLTGYGDDRRIRRALRDLGFHYMDKPWDNDAILAMIESALPRQSQAR